MVAKLTRLTHKIAIQLYLVAESCTICSSRSRWSVRKLLDTSSYVVYLVCRLLANIRWNLQYLNYFLETLVNVLKKTFKLLDTPSYVVYLVCRLLANIRRNLQYLNYFLETLVNVLKKTFKLFLVHLLILVTEIIEVCVM
jgi:hypothetical protein